MKKKNITKEIKEQFKNKNSFSREELLSFYRKYEPELNNQTFGWRVFDLKKRNIIRSVYRGIYTVNYKPNFNPGITPKLKKIYTKLIDSYKNFDKEWETRDWMCVWSINWLNEFMVHQIFVNYVIVEIEPNTAENAFYTLKNENIKNVFYMPDKDLYDKYIIERNDSVIVKGLFSRSPIQKTNKIKIPTLEKILVDLFCEPETYYAFQGKEFIEICRNAIRKYNINFTKMFNYARRRRREKELKELLSKNLKNELSGDSL